MKDKTKKKLNTVVVFIGIIPFFFIVYLLLGPVIKVITEEYSGKPMRIISETLKVRSDKSKRAYIVGQYNYGTEVKVYDVYDNKWAEVSVEDIKGFMALEFLVTPEQFYLINGMYGNDYAKQAVRMTKYRKAIAGYLSDNGYTTNIPQKIKTKLYGESDSRPKRIFFAEAPGSRYNTYAYGDFNGDNSQDAAYILTDPDNGKRYLVVLDLDAQLPGKYSKLLYLEELKYDWTFIRKAPKRYKFFTGEKKQRLEIDGLLKGANRDDSFNDPVELLLYDGHNFNTYIQPQEE